MQGFHPPCARVAVVVHAQVVDNSLVQNFYDYDYDLEVPQIFFFFQDPPNASESMG
jgi:hypothetical protein